MRSSDEILKIFLETSRDLIREPLLEQKLRIIAQGVVQSGVFDRSVVQLYAESYGEKIFGAFGLTEEEEKWLFEHDVMERTDYERLLKGATELDGMYYIPYAVLKDKYLDQILLSSDRIIPNSEWHPDDMFYVPLNSSQGITMGNITADEPPNGKIPTVEFAQLMTPFIALAAATLEQELSRRHDYLTGLLNGNFFYDILQRRIDSNQPFGLAYCDLDGLKKINDHFGHEAGDRAIQQFAKELQLMIDNFHTERKLMAFRLHGDEFALLCDANEPDEDRLLPAFVVQTIQNAGGSVGMAMYQPSDTVSSLVRRAELNMYRDKDFKKVSS